MGREGKKSGTSSCGVAPGLLDGRSQDNFLSLHSWTFLNGSVYCPQAIAGKS